MRRKKIYYIGIDFGTQGVRCGIIDSEGDIIVVSESSYSTSYPHPGWAKQNPNDWLKSLDLVLKKCTENVGADVLERLKGISVCATSSTVVPVDSDGNALCEAILWMDNRAKQEARLINDTRNAILKYCGNEVSVEWLIPKILWLKKNKPEAYKKAFKVVEQLDFINYHLTGKWCASICQVTCKGNYVKDHGKWNNNYFKQIGLNEFEKKLNTEVKMLGEPIGQLAKIFVEKYSLPNNINVYQGGIDAHIAMIGIGVCKPGDMGVIMGTSFVHLALSKQPLFINGLWGPYNDAVVPGLYCIEGGQVSAGSITKWFLNEFGIDSKDGYMEMTEKAEKINPGSDGVITLDFFQGNRTPYKDPKAKGVMYGLTLSHTKAHIFRSILEGIAFGTKNIIETMKRGNLQINNIMACGGVTKNLLWLKIIADITKTPIILTKNSANAGILGCAMLSAIGSGEYDSFEAASKSMVQITDTINPEEDEYDNYKENYKNYLKIYSRLKDIMKESKCIE